MSCKAFLVEYPIYTGSSVAYRITTYRRRKSGFFLKILPVNWQDFLFWFGRKLKKYDVHIFLLFFYLTKLLQWWSNIYSLFHQEAFLLRYRRHKSNYHNLLIKPCLYGVTKIFRVGGRVGDTKVIIITY